MGKVIDIFSKKTRGESDDKKPEKDSESVVDAMKQLLESAKDGRDLITESIEFGFGGVDEFLSEIAQSDTLQFGPKMPDLAKVRKALQLKRDEIKKAVKGSLSQTTYAVDNTMIGTYTNKQLMTLIANAEKNEWMAHPTFYQALIDEALFRLR